MNKIHEYRIVIKGSEDYIGVYSYLSTTKRELQREEEIHPEWDMSIERREVFYSDWCAFTDLTNITTLKALDKH